jgi:mitofilin
VPEPEKKAEAAVAKGGVAAAKDAALDKGAAAKSAALAKGADAKDVVSSKASSVASSADAAAGKAVNEKNTLVAKAVQAKESVKAAVAPVQDKVAAAVAPVKEKVVAATQALASAPAKAGEKAATAGHEVSDDVAHLVRNAEHVLSGKPIAELLNDAGAAVKDAVTTPGDVAQEAQGNVYSGPLPVGFEPPPGFSRPAPPKPKASAKAPADGKDGKAAPAPEPLPLLAPAVAQLGASEPVISHLAGTIDTLASYLNSVPTASDQARAVLSTAQGDLEALAGRVDAVRKEETGRLEQELERQAQEYNSRVLQAEMEAQDRIDTQEDSFRKILDEERRNLVAAYREKLDKELATQSEIIDQR